MKDSGICPKCGSTKIIADALIQTTSDSGELTVATYHNPQAILFKDRQQSTVSAWVCGSCGFVEYYVDNPAILLPPPP